MDNKNWNEKNPKDKRIGYENIISWLKEEVKSIFSDFSKIMQEEYKLRPFKVWTSKYGWKYKYAANGFTFLSKVLFINNIITIEGQSVTNNNEFKNVLKKIKIIYEEKNDQILFMEEKQNNSKKSKVQKNNIQSLPNLNQFIQPKKICSQKIEKLYIENSKMIYNND